MLRATRAQHSPEMSHPSITVCPHKHYGECLGLTKTESSRNVSHAPHQSLRAGRAPCRRRRRSIPPMPSRQADVGSGAETKLNPSPLGLAINSSPNSDAKLFNDAI